MDGVADICREHNLFVTLNRNIELLYSGGKKNAFNGRVFFNSDRQNIKKKPDNHIKKKIKIDFAFTKSV